MDSSSRSHIAGPPCMTKMLVSLLVLLASSPHLVVESAIAIGSCPSSEWGTEKTTENWDCDNGASSCSKEIETCSSDGSWQSQAGTEFYDANGSFTGAVGGGWDCRHIN